MFNGGYIDDDEKGVKNGMHSFSPGEEPGDDVKVKQQKRRDQAPLWNCRLIANYPISCFFVTLGLHLAAVFVMFILLVPGYDILPTETGNIFMDIRDNTDFLRGLAWQYRDEDDVIQRIQFQGERTEVGEGMEYYFECKGCNVFTPENLLLMQEAEQKLVDDDDFQNKYCYQIVNTSSLNIEQLQWEYMCFPPYSVLRLFDGSLATLLSAQVELPAGVDLLTPDYPSLYDPTFSNIETVLYTAKTLHSQTKEILDYFLSKDSIIELDEAKSSIVRGSIALGLPLAGYDTEWDNREKQLDKIKRYIEDDYYDIAFDLHEDGAGKLNFYFNSESAFYKFFDVAIFKDTMFIIGSFLFIYGFVWLQTGSIFLTVFTTGSVLTSFCISNLIYRFVLDIRYFGNLHFLVVFIVLGIGVDDIFVFNDTWNQTGYYQYKTLAHRLSDCFRRTSKTMLITSLTTVVAFSVNIASPFLTISTLSIFAALSILVLYCSVVIYFPAVIVFYHLYIEKICRCCFESRENQYNYYGERDNKNIIVGFFGGPFHKFVTNKIASPCIIAIFAAITGVFIYFITTVQIDIDMITVNPFRVNNNFGKFFDRRYNDFTQVDQPLRVFMVWGLKKQDLDECQWSELDCWGETDWDDKFDLNSEENQRALRDVCNNLRSLSAKEIEDLHIKINEETGEPEIHCFLEEMDAFLHTDETNRMVCDPGLGVPDPTAFTQRYPTRYNTDNFTIPVRESDAQEMMDATSYMYGQENFTQSYEHWFEIAMSHWLYNGWQTISTSSPFPLCLPAVRMEIPMMLGMSEQFRKYNDLLGEGEISETVTYATPPYPLNILGPAFDEWIDFTFKYGTKLKYAAIVVNTTLDAKGLRYGKGLPIRDKWEDFMQDQLKDMPSGVKDGFQTTPADDNYSFNLWHNLAAQKALVDTAWIGIGVGIGVAYVTMAIGTMNLLVALLGTITLACITVLVVGLIPMAGWKIEMFQTVILTLIVGFEADYTIHMAIGYARSAHSDRKGRTRDALAEVGISIFSGFISTIGSCLFMFFAVLTFFPEFAGIVFATLGFSFIFSTILFPTLLGLIGPNNECASLWPLWRRITCTVVAMVERPGDGCSEPRLALTHNCISGK